MRKWLTVKRFSSRAEALMAQEVLRQRGIQSRVMADDAGGMNPSISAIKGVELLVEEEDLPLARDSLYLITD